MGAATGEWFVACGLLWFARGLVVPRLVAVGAFNSFQIPTPLWALHQALWLGRLTLSSATCLYFFVCLKICVEFSVCSHSGGVREQSVLIEAPGRKVAGRVSCLCSLLVPYSPALSSVYVFVLQGAVWERSVLEPLAARVLEELPGMGLKVRVRKGGKWLIKTMADLIGPQDACMQVRQ